MGNVIEERSSLLLMTPENFNARTNIDVRTRQEVTNINADTKTVVVKNLESGETYEESYDTLILATGSSPLRPPIPGVDDADVFQLWTIPDMDRILSRVNAGAKRAVVVGAGFIGIEVAENLRERGIAVDLVERMPQVLPTLDQEMTTPLAAELARKGVHLHLGKTVTGIHRQTTDEAAPSSLRVSVDDGSDLQADIVVMSIGVRPNSELAADAGLELSERKGVITNDAMQTSDPAIYAVGDMVSVKNLITGEQTQIPLAGPANRQGRIAAENIFGRKTTYKGSLGTAVVKVFGLTAASSGMTERLLKHAGMAYEKIYLHPFSNATYYPGARPMSIKLLFDKDGKILGVQAVGEKGVAKRVDVIATAMRGGMTVFDLEELELAYAPPYGSAKDPVNFTGMIAANVLEGNSTVVHYDALPENALFLDVREQVEYDIEHIDGCRLIPLGTLRNQLDTLPKDRHIVLYCKVGLRGYLGERILKENGFDCSNLSGGYTSWKLFNPPTIKPETPVTPSCCTTSQQTTNDAKESSPMKLIDVSTLQCPGPIVRIRQELDLINVGESIELNALPGFEPDLTAWCQSSGNEVINLDASGDTLTAQIKKGEPSSAKAEGNVPESAAIVCFSNDLDKVMAAFIIATGMATLGCKVSMFFTFWGLNVLRKENPPSVAKDILSKMFGFMMPRGARKLALSKMHMGGMGTAMMKHVMNKKNVAPLPDLITSARELGVKFIACDMAMDVMGITRQELLEDVDEIAGVASFAALAKDSGTTLFI
ncbi:hypothetical protein BVX99_02805 [bacterium F16]|nr:hypothetical protein BVX99_02805 [bacterium F16]